jgi:predicted esterase
MRSLLPLLPCLAWLAPLLAQTPTTPELRELAAAVDAFVVDRWTNTAIAPLVERLQAANLDANRLEAMLRQGRPSYPRIAEPVGSLSARLPLASEHVDHATEHFVYVPTSYDPLEPAPLLVVAHGGSAARDLAFGARAARGGLEPWLASAEKHGFLVVAPLTDRGWMQIGTSLLFSAIARMQRDFHVDPDRVFLTGHSMGGHVTWRSSFWFTDRWAAVSPMSGGYDYVKSKDVFNLVNVPGYATFGAREPYQINEFNKIIGTWMKDHAYPWTNQEKEGEHEIFLDEVEKVAAFFAAQKRDLYRKKVWARVGGLQFTAPDTNPAWGKAHVWNPERPIELSTMFWLRFFPPPPAMPPEKHVQTVFGEVKDGNLIELVCENVRRLRIHLHPQMVDFSKPVTIVTNGKKVFAGPVKASLGTMLQLVREFGDRGRIFHAAIDVMVHGDKPVPEPRGG